MIYDNIVKIANKKNISIRIIEQRAGLGNGTISKWKNSSPNVDNLMSVAKVLKTTISVLTKE